MPDDQLLLRPVLGEASDRRHRGLDVERLPRLEDQPGLTVEDC